VFSVTIVVKISGDYPKKKFDSVAKQAWLEFFKSVEIEFDFAHCMIHAFSGTISFSARNSKIAETDSGFEPSDPVLVLVDGIVEMTRPLIERGDEDELEELGLNFLEWAMIGILNGFLSNDVQKNYERWKQKNRSFAIVGSPTDEGLLEDKLLFLLWSSNKSLTVKKLRSNQKKAQAEDHKKRPNSKIIKARNANKP
jgi:hypothetical protein